MEQTRNSYITKRSFKVFIIATIMNMFILQLNSFIDSVIMGHALSADAMSVINLVSPIISLVMLPSVLFAQGALLVMSKAVGMQLYEKAHRAFLTALLCSIGFSFLFAVIISVFSNDVIGMLTTEQRLIPMLHEYVPIGVFVAVAFAFQNVYTVLLQMCTRSELVIHVSIAQMVINILLDLLFVVGLKMGVSGAAYATILSYLLSLILVIPAVKEEKRFFALANPFKDWLPYMVKSCIRLGMASATAILLVSLMLFFVNALALSHFGPDGLFVFSVFVQMLAIEQLITQGIGVTVQTIGSTLWGEHDMNGFSLLIRHVWKFTLACLLFITVIVFVAPEFLCKCFGADAELSHLSVDPLRLLGLSLLPIGVIEFFSYCYSTQRRTILAVSIIVLLQSMVAVTFWTTERYWLDGFWTSLLIGSVSAFIVCIIVARLISLNNKMVSNYMLISKYVDVPCIDYSVPFDETAVQDAIDKINIFLEICELPVDMNFRIQSCVEEMMYNIVRMGMQTGKSGFFDVRVVEIVDDGDYRIQVSLKDDGRPFNPVKTFDSAALDTADVDELIDDDNNELALMMINNLCKDIDYNYFNGVNCTIMTFRKE